MEESVDVRLERLDGAMKHAIRELSDVRRDHDALDTLVREDWRKHPHAIYTRRKFRGLTKKINRQTLAIVAAIVLTGVSTANPDKAAIVDLFKAIAAVMGWGK